MSPNDATPEPRMPSPPAVRGDLPAARAPGTYKVELEDFVVDELALYEPDGEGEHVWVRVEKRGIGTMPLVERLAEVFGKRARELGYAGLKDARAIARQWI